MPILPACDQCMRYLDCDDSTNKQLLEELELLKEQLEDFDPIYSSKHFDIKIVCKNEKHSPDIMRART